MSSQRLHCSAHYFLDEGSIDINLFKNNIPQLGAAAIGPNAISDEAWDLIDIASLIFLLEHNMPGKQQLNKIAEIDVKFGLKKPTKWTSEAILALEELLFFMGGTKWNFEFFKHNTQKKLPQLSKEKNQVTSVSLFSGGLDSLCGAAELKREDDTRLVSFYTRQKTRQKRLAESLGISSPVQWGWLTRPPSGRGRGFRYRSFMFLCIAAATARSYGTNKIYQFENGILASGVAPSPSFQTTKHAHHRLHRLCEVIFNEILGEQWEIENPFKNKTKREAYNTLVKEIGEEKASDLANQTETCWNLNAGFKKEKGDIKRKKNGLPCGFCVPCLIRQTAVTQTAWVDLREDDARNHPARGRYFREYYAMVKRIQSVRNGTLGDFYIAMNTFLHDAITPRGGYSIEELRDLFLRFSDEFMETYIKTQGE